MLSNSHSSVRPASEPERAYLESLIRADYERCHPGETIDDMIRRASFSKEDKGLLRDWMAVATMRAAARHLVSPPSMAPNEKFTRSSSDAIRATLSSDWVGGQLVPYAHKEVLSGRASHLRDRGSDRNRRSDD